jgi:glutaredoxin-like protein NrdH
MKIYQQKARKEHREMVELESTVIKVYTNERCQPCRLTKARLTALGYEYEEISITDEIGAELRKLGYMSAPVVDVVSYYFEDGEPVAVNTLTWSGHKPEMIDSVLSD